MWRKKIVFKNINKVTVLKKKKQKIIFSIILFFKSFSKKKIKK